MSDVEACPVCLKPVAAPEVKSYSLVMWDPVAYRNVLVQMFCDEHYPLPAPDWLKRVAGERREEVP